MSAIEPPQSVTGSGLLAALTAAVQGTANVGTHAPTIVNNADGTWVIRVPGHSGSNASPVPNWIDLGVGSEGRYEIAPAGADVTLTAVGRSSSGFERRVRYTFKSERAAFVMPGAGVLTRSPVTMSNGAQISGGDVVSATAQNVATLNISGGAKIDGNFYYPAAGKPPVISNGARVGQVLTMSEAPKFPIVETTPFASFVPSASAPQGPKVITATSSIAATATLTNIRIKANANTSFGNSVNLNGVIYIESPNKVSFGGGVRISGVIVTDNNLAVPAASNQITLDNGVRVDGVETLDACAFAAGERIAELKQLSGVLVLAPNYKVVIAGGTRTYAGTMVGNEFDISNGYKGTIAGTLINAGDTLFKMMGGGKITFAPGPVTAPGLYGESRLRMDPTSYVELGP
jgi:hypothetical protein